MMTLSSFSTGDTMNEPEHLPHSHCRTKPRVVHTMGANNYSTSFPCMSETVLQLFNTIKHRADTPLGLKSGRIKLSAD